MLVRTTLDAATDLYEYVLRTHWDGQKLVGPDPIGKIHWRVTRFVRSYLPFLPREDAYIYLQGQAYWIRSNIQLHRLTGDPVHMERVRQCADYIVQAQPEDGAWRHPPIWGRRGFVSTVEGVWASLGLMAAYRETAVPAYREAAERWYGFQVTRLGFQPTGNDGLAANYYAHSENKVPNVTTMLIWLTAELADRTGDDRFLQYTKQMCRFIIDSQMESGELPYEVGARPHFMCYQYNSFQFLDLAFYYDLTGDEDMLPVLERLARFLATGVTTEGSCRYNCHAVHPEINYWTGAIGAALLKAKRMQLGDYSALSDRAYERLLGKQEVDGRFHFSERNYKLLRDRRSYPRYLSMILNHLLYRVET